MTHPKAASIQQVKELGPDYVYWTCISGNAGYEKPHQVKFYKNSWNTLTKYGWMFGVVLNFSRIKGKDSELGETSVDCHHFPELFLEQGPAYRHWLRLELNDVTLQLHRLHGRVQKVQGEVSSGGIVDLLWLLHRARNLADRCCGEQDL